MGSIASKTPNHQTTNVVGQVHIQAYNAACEHLNLARDLPPTTVTYWLCPDVCCSWNILCESVAWWCRLVDGVEVLARILHPHLVSKTIPAATVMKLLLHGGQRCRPQMLHQYFKPYQWKFMLVELLGCSASTVAHGMMNFCMLGVEQDSLVHYVALCSLGIA